MSSDDSPPIIRPIPRRPFDLNVAGPTPPPEEDDDASAPPSPNPNDIRLLRATFLDPNRPRDASSGSLAGADQQGGGGGGSGSLSRAQSIMNLTASTLFGIYSPTTLSTAGHGSSGYYSTGTGTGTGAGGADRSEPGTPWGTGAESPLKRTAGVDAPTFALMKGRSKLLLRRRSTQSNGAARMPLEGRGRAPGVAGWRLALSLAARAALLFGLGTGYGLFVSRLHDRHKLTGLGGGGGSGASESGGGSSIANPGLEWKYLLFWGVAGVVLGALLPWFDTVWDEMFGKGSRARARAARAREAAVVGGGDGADDEDEEDDDDDEEEEEEEEDKGTSPSTDWALVIRGIGAFAGIVFAIVRTTADFFAKTKAQSVPNHLADYMFTNNPRLFTQRKLPWASTMQVSLTLALVNPFLWYLIDRSKSGFMLAATVGLTGSSLLLGLNPAMMPTPAAAGAGAAYYDDDAAAAAAAMGLRSNGSRGGGGGGAAASETGAGGLARHHHETIEAGIWMLSVLFCSCVCFGNIGRRLALDGSAAARGRWGGVR
ncbi:uncharacterized protein E0L32_009570 [Thyridium curvatum]|uniref:Uncharacterized protein n=1 Tax=Thyridium curvatum TaxID=1093900 RepID=A0A507AVP4_9PEZI|nr:uncharacterized protein E0L32_009570 [Thyridium curvatum]TPX08991.1 hypothetical protein E0L32_009570 [Thyridium curvatum]